MSAQVLQFTGLPDNERLGTAHMPSIGRGDCVEPRVRSGTGKECNLSLPLVAAAMVEVVIGHLLRAGG